MGSRSDRGFAVRGFAVRGLVGLWVRHSWARGFVQLAVHGFDDLGLTISPVVRRSPLSGFAISLSLSLSLSLCVFGNDLKVKFWLKILSGSKALILRSTKILFRKIHFPYATKHPHLRKSFFGSDLKPKQTQLKTTNSLNKINITTCFENLTVELHVLYALNTHVKFCVNQILFTI